MCIYNCVNTGTSSILVFLRTIYIYFYRHKISTSYSSSPMFNLDVCIHVNQHMYELSHRYPSETLSHRTPYITCLVNSCLASPILQINWSCFFHIVHGYH
jgi:hypothetical protein